MDISIEIIRQKIDGVLKGQISREETSEWATRMRHAADDRILEYRPRADEERIWKSIIYLEGIDTQNMPGSYLHTEDDIAEFIKAL